MELLGQGSPKTWRLLGLQNLVSTLPKLPHEKRLLADAQTHCTPGAEYAELHDQMESAHAFACDQLQAGGMRQKGNYDRRARGGLRSGVGV